MMVHTPLVSVIIPVCNVGKSLTSCLDGVFGQRLRDIDVICIGDTSLVMLREYCARDERVRAIVQTNHSGSAARNAGLDTAKGKRTVFVDSDDEVVPDIWESRLAEASYPDVKFKVRWKLRDGELFKVSMTGWGKCFLRARTEEGRLRFPHGVYFEGNVFVLNFIGTLRSPQVLSLFPTRGLHRRHVPPPQAGPRLPLLRQLRADVLRQAPPRHRDMSAMAKGGSSLGHGRTPAKRGWSRGTKPCVP